MKKNKLIFFVIALTVMGLSAAGILYFNKDIDLYNTEKLIAKKQTLNKRQTKEFARKTLIVCATDLDETNTGAINIEKTNNIYTLTYNKSKDAKKAYEKYSKDDSIIYCEFDTVLETSEVKSSSLLDAIVGNHIEDSDNEIYENIVIDENLNTNKKNITVVVIDSGANGSYKQSYNAFDGSNDVTDNIGHGTEMVEIIKKQTGSLNYEIVPIKVANDKGYATVSTLVKALDYASALNPAVVNMSLTSMTSSKTEIINEYIAKMGHNGTAVIVSAGNNSDNVTKYSPASSKDAIVVGSCDKIGKLRSFSNYGETIDYLITSDSTSEAAAITSGIYVKAYLMNCQPEKLLQESKIAYRYDGSTIDKINERRSIANIDERLWWCADSKYLTYSEIKKESVENLGPAYWKKENGSIVETNNSNAKTYKLNGSITVYSSVWNNEKIGTTTWGKNIEFRVVNHYVGGYPYVKTGDNYYVAIAKKSNKTDYAWFKLQTVVSASKYTNTVRMIPTNYTDIVLGTTSFKKLHGDEYSFKNYAYKPCSVPKGYVIKDEIRLNGTSYNINKTFTMPSENRTFTYRVTPKTFAITYNLNGGTKNSSGTYPTTYNITQKFGSGSDEINIKVPTKKGYQFNNWTVQRNSGNITLNSGTDNYENYAVAQCYQGHSYTLTIDSIKKTAGNAKKVDIVLFNLSDNEEIATKELSIKDDTQSVTIKCPTDTQYNGKRISLLIYAGKRGSTANNCITFNNIKCKYNTIASTNHTIYQNKKNLWTNVDEKKTKTAFLNVCNKSETGALSLTANWTANSYRVAFHDDISDQTVYQDFSYDVSQKLKKNTFTREGYTFAGWATDQNGIVKYADEQEVCNLTNVNDRVIWLYAVWNTKKYTVKFDANGGTGTMDDLTNCVYDIIYTPNNTFTRTNYTFSGWAITKTETSGFSSFRINQLSPTSDTITLYAVWISKSSSITAILFESNTEERHISSQPVVVGATDTKLNANVFTNPGKKFIGWDTDAKGKEVVYQDEGIYHEAITAPTSLFAVWQDISYTLKFDANGGEGSIPDITGTYGTAITLPDRNPDTIYKTGYCFLGWSKSADATVPEYPNCGVYIDNDQAENKVTTLYAVWVQIPVSARDIYLEYEDITKINDDEFMNEEADIRVNENEYNITLKSSQIINLYEVYANAQKHGTEGSESDAKATVTYSTGDSVEITFKVYVAEDKIFDMSTTANIRYIRKDTINTLRSTSDWIKSDKNSLLREVLNKDLSALKSYKVTKAKL